MREIKFRGKKIDNGEWVYGGIAILDKTYIIRELKEGLSTKFISQKKIDEKRVFGGLFVEVHPETVGQFLIKKCNKGNNIYEGDIVAYFMGTGLWETHELNYFIDVVDFLGDDYDLHRALELTLLGNIFENPELIPDEIKQIKPK